MKPEYPESKSIDKPKPGRRFLFSGILKVSVRILIIIVMIESFRILLGTLITHPIITQWGTIDKGFWTEALILGQETVYTAPISGELITTVETGTMIPQGEIIARIDLSNRSTVPESNLQTSSKLQSIKREEQTLKDDLIRIDEAIKDKRALLVKKGAQSLTVEEIKEDLMNLEQEKGRILRNIKQNKEQFQILNNFSGAGSNSYVVAAQKPGYCYYQYDGWEGKLTPDSLKQLSFSDLSHHFPLKTAGNKINQGEIFGKTIDPFNLRLVIKIDRNIKIPRPGEVWLVRNNDNLSKAVIYNVAHRTKGNLVVMEDPGIARNFLPERHCRIYVVYSNVTGVKVPVRAIYKKQNSSYVKIRKGDGFREQTIRILESDNNDAVIQGIGFGETIISR